MGRGALAIEDRGREFWRPEPLFAGRPAFVIGGGPSLRGFEFDRLRGRHVVAINAAGYFVPWAEVLYFNDRAWFLANRPLIDSWAGLVTSSSRHAKTAAPDRIRRVEMDGDVRFCNRASRVRGGRSSGHQAIGLAAALGAQPIVLLGFDLQSGLDGATHFHDRYREADAKVYRRDFLPAFAGWRRAAEADGVDIINATPGSALVEFPFVPIDEVLTWPIS